MHLQTGSLNTAEENQSRENYIQQVRSLLMEQYGDVVPLAHVHSYGCQQNVSDGEKIKGLLAVMGYGFTDSPQNADLVIYNTCAVREHAQQRVYGNVGALKHNKKRNPNMLIGLCGCMMQQEEVAAKIKKSYPHVDFVFGTYALPRLPQIVFEKLSQGKRVFDIEERPGVITENIPIRRDGNIKAWVPVMYGCNNFCSYCIVPYVRGRERSRNSADILAEVESLIQQGYKEITLLGQNVNSYGRGLEEDINFSGLLRKINAISGDFQIRFMTSHPKDATKELIDTIAQCNKICKHLHLPVQCGSDRILKAMNRGYTSREYLELIDYAKKAIPDLTLTSDIIVGFPGETYEDFLQTMDLIQQVGYSCLYTFIFSRRKGTKAYDMPDVVSEEEKGKWFRQMLRVQDKIAMEQNQKLVGKVLCVLPESEGKSGKEYIMGRTSGNIICEVKADSSYIGRFIWVKVTQAHNWAVSGELVEQP